MSINSISSQTGGNLYISEIKLPKYLLDELEALGIDPSQVKSAADAKKLIQEANESNNKESFEDNSNTNSNLRERAEALAEKLNIQVSDNDTIDEILDNVNSVIDFLLNHAIRTNDESEYKKIMHLKNEAKSIEAENNGGSTAQNLVFSYMDLIANQNKAALGIK